MVSGIQNFITTWNATRTGAFFSEEFKSRKQGAVDRVDPTDGVIVLAHAITATELLSHLSPHLKGTALKVIESYLAVFSPNVILYIGVAALSSRWYFSESREASERIASIEKVFHFAVSSLFWIGLAAAASSSQPVLFSGIACGLLWRTLMELVGKKISLEWANAIDHGTKLWLSPLIFLLTTQSYLVAASQLMALACSVDLSKEKLCFFLDFLLINLLRNQTVPLRNVLAPFSIPENPSYDEINAVWEMSDSEWESSYEINWAHLLADPIKSLQQNALRSENYEMLLTIWDQQKEIWISTEAGKEKLEEKLLQALSNDDRFIQELNHALGYKNDTPFRPVGEFLQHPSLMFHNKTRAAKALTKEIVQEGIDVLAPGEEHLSYMLNRTRREITALVDILQIKQTSKGHLSELAAARNAFSRILPVLQNRASIPEFHLHLRSHLIRIGVSAASYCNLGIRDTAIEIENELFADEISKLPWQHTVLARLQTRKEVVFQSLHNRAVQSSPSLIQSNKHSHEDIRSMLSQGFTPEKPIPELFEWLVSAKARAWLRTEYTEAAEEEIGHFCFQNNFQIAHEESSLHQWIDSNPNLSDQQKRALKYKMTPPSAPSLLPPEKQHLFANTRRLLEKRRDVFYNNLVRLVKLFSGLYHKKRERVQ